jgi:hypothetical protein
MRPPCRRECEAGRDGQGLPGWAFGGPAGGRRVDAAPSVAPTLMAFSQVFSARRRRASSAPWGDASTVSSRVLVGATLDVMVKGTSYRPMPTKSP